MFNNSGINPEALRYNFKGDWNADTVYRKNDTVRIRGCTYYCKTNKMAEHGWNGFEFHPTKSFSDSEYWGIHTPVHVWTGAWSSKRLYQPGDIAKYNGDWYICLEGDSNYNNNPIYKNGVANRTWQKVMTANNTHEKRYKISHFANRNPIGWQHNMGHFGNGSAESQGFRPINQMGAINWQGQPVLLGGQKQTYGFGAGFKFDWNVTRSGSATSGGANHSLQIINMWDMSSYHTINAKAENANMISLTNERECIQFVTCGYNSMYLLNDGTLWITGYNGHGQMGDNTTSDYNYYGLTYRAGQDRNRWWDHGSNNPLYNKFIVKVDMTGKESFDNSSTMYALDIDGNMYAWGYNGNGQCAQGISTSNAYKKPTQVPREYFNDKSIVDFWATGNGSNGACFAINTDGDVFGWGYNGNGGLGNGDFRNQWRPQRVKYDFHKFGGIKKWISQGHGSYDGRVVLCNDGSIHMWGYIHADSQSIQHGMDRSSSVCTPRHANMAYWDAMKGTGRSRQKIAEFTIGDDVEDMWYVGSRYKTLIMKQKSTGDIYTTGYQSDHSSVIPHPVAGANISDHEYWNQTPRWPMRVVVGDLKDIVHVVRTNNGGTRSLYFQNSDGRVMQTGYRGYYNAGDGVDEHADNSIDSSSRWSLLNESNGAHNSPRQLKGKNIAGAVIDMAASQGHWYGLNTEGRIMKIGKVEPYYADTSGRRHDNDSSDDYSYGHRAMSDGQV